MNGLNWTQREIHNVVKFIVKVKLVENSVNSHVGNVIETKVMTQYNMPKSVLNILKGNHVEVLPGS